MTSIGPTARRVQGVKLPDPVGDITCLPSSVLICLDRIRNRGQHFILVNPQGQIYAIPSTDIRAFALIEKTPTWLAGVFEALSKIHGKIVWRLDGPTLCEAITATYEAMA